MKLICLLLLILPFFGISQSHYLGIEGGYSYTSANILSGTSGTIKAKHLYYGGINYQFHAEQFFFLNIGIRYDRKGFELNNENLIHKFNDSYHITDTIGNYNYNFHQVGVPLKIGFKFGKKVFALISAGLIPSYTVAANSELSLRNVADQEISSIGMNTWTNMKNFELPWIGEIGLGIHFNDIILMTLTASYTQSLTKHLLPYQTIENNVLQTDYRTVRFKGIHAGLGLLFKLQKKKRKLPKYSPSS